MMTDIQLYTKLYGLPSNLKMEVAHFIDFLKLKSQNKVKQNSKRVAGLAKGLIDLKENFDKPIDEL